MTRSGNVVFAALTLAACARFGAEETPHDGGSDVATDAARSDGGVGGPPRYVQSAAKAVEVDAQTLTLSFTRAVQPHSALLLAVTAEQDTVAVSDDVGDVFKVIATTSAGSQSFHVALADDVRGGATRVTLAYAGSNRFIEAYVHEYADVAADALVDATRSVAECDFSPGCMKSPPILAPARSMLFGFAVGGELLAGPGFEPRETLNHNVTEDRVVLEVGMVQAAATKTNDYPTEIIFGVVLRGR